MPCDSARPNRIGRSGCALSRLRSHRSVATWTVSAVAIVCILAFTTGTARADSSSDGVPENGEAAEPLVPPHAEPLIPSGPKHPAIATDPQSSSSKQEPKNVLIITIDTLRADHLETYGYKLRTSPNIQKLAARSVVFEKAYSHASWTLPAMVSMLTSLNTTAHRCWEANDKLDASVMTLPEILKAAGYETMGVSASLFFSRSFGLAQGFDSLDTKIAHRHARSQKATSSPDLTTKALEFIQTRKSGDRPWMFWAHYLDPHNDYMHHDDGPRHFEPRTPVNLYDGEIAFTDRSVGRLIEGLRSSGQSESTIVVLASDHGEEFLDHGGRFHGVTVFEEQLRVPFIIHAPGIAARRVKMSVGTIDLMPTVLDLLDLPIPDRIDGRSLVRAMRGEMMAPQALLVEMRGSPGTRYRAVVSGGYKLILDSEGNPTGLFDLWVDPRERRSVHHRQQRRARDMQLAIDRIVAQSKEHAPNPTSTTRADLTQYEIEQLRALGYVVEDE